MTDARSAKGIEWLEREGDSKVAPEAESLVGTFVTTGSAARGDSGGLARMVTNCVGPVL